jgi:hypothetical protein
MCSGVGEILREEERPQPRVARPRENERCNASAHRSSDTMLDASFDRSAARRGWRAVATHARARMRQPCSRNNILVHHTELAECGYRAPIAQVVATS